MPRTKTKNASKRGENEDSKSVTSHRSGSQARSQRGAGGKSGRKGAKGRTSAVSERSASKSRVPKEEFNSSQQIKAEVMSNADAAPAASAKPDNIPAQIEQQKQIMRRGVTAYPPQAGPRPVDPRYAQAAAAAAASGAPGSAGLAQQKPGQPGQSGQRVPINLPPQITAADVARAHTNMPSETELVEAEIAGEKIKASVKTIDYLRRFEGFLNTAPSKKMEFINEKFFRKIPRDTGVFKTNRAKEVKCPVCMKVIASPQMLDSHFNKEHSDLVSFGMECSNGEFKISNKVANLVAMFCFTHSSATPGIVNIAKARLAGKEPKFYDLGKEANEGEENNQ